MPTPTLLPVPEPRAYELQLRRVREVGPRRPIDSPEAAYRYWCEVICAADWYCPCKEHLVVLFLDTGCRLWGHHLVSVGSMTETVAEPRDILAPVLCAGSGAFLLMHNHPGGNPAPSKPDQRLTARLRALARLLGIPFHDHIITTSLTPDSFTADLDLYETPYYSFAEEEDGWG